MHTYALKLTLNGLPSLLLKNMEAMGASVGKRLSLKIGKVHSEFRERRRKNSACGSFWCDNYTSGAKSTDNPPNSIKTPALQKNAQTKEIITKAHIHTPSLKRRKPLTANIL